MIFRSNSNKETENSNNIADESEKKKTGGGISKIKSVFKNLF
jgi:hypothetical protein